MKKIITSFAIMALLIGACSINVNAQDVRKPQTQEINKANWESVLKEFEQTVDQCVTLYKAMLKNTNSEKTSSSQFSECLKKAEGLATKLEKAKTQNLLSRSQVDRYNKASAKLSQVNIK